MSYSKSSHFNILYIEDDKSTQKLISHLLQEHCTNLILAKDGLDAFLKFEKMSIDLILTDLTMPNINGLDFIKMIRNTNSDVAIIVTSIHTNNEILQQCLNYGIQGYLKKPIQFNLLKETIDKVKKKSQQNNLTKEYNNIINASAIISKINKNGILTYINERFCQVSGFKKEELIGRHHNVINFDKESSLFFMSMFTKTMKTKKLWTGVLKYQTKTHELYYLKTTIQPIIDSNGDVEQLITLSIPITDIIHPEEQLSDYLKQHKQSILLLVKIEEFKYIEQTFTKKITKKLQKLFAKELLKHMPQQCEFSKIYLLNNGEFAFVKTHHQFTDKRNLTTKLQEFQKKVNQEKIKIGVVDYSLTIACSLACGTSTLENAQLGLEELRQTNKRFIVASNFLYEASKRSNNKLNKFIMLKEAISSYNIVSYFQPIINNQTLEIEKYESLVRLIDKDHKVHTPYHFLEIAKEGNYYHKITSRVLRNSFRALFNTNINISINLSALDMEDERTKKEFFILLEKYKTEAHRITIELVEDEKIRDTKGTQAFIKEIKKHGIKIALDDFGKGFSNYARIQSYQPDYIKIDGSLIRNIEHDKFSKDLVETIVFFAKKQNIKTIAEFVENENIFNILKDLGVDYSQGHYFGKASLLEKFISPAL